jgi:hypothetical protein
MVNQLTNVDDKFIMIKLFFLSFLFYSLPMGSIESKLIVNLSMIICRLTKVNDEFIIIESFLELGPMVPGHRINLIKCDKLYLSSD